MVSCFVYYRDDIFLFHLPCTVGGDVSSETGLNCEWLVIGKKSHSLGRPHLMRAGYHANIKSSNCNCWYWLALLHPNWIHCYEITINCKKNGSYVPIGKKKYFSKFMSKDKFRMKSKILCVRHNSPYTLCVSKYNNIFICKPFYLINTDLRSVITSKVKKNMIFEGEYFLKWGDAILYRI